MSCGDSTWRGHFQFIVIKAAIAFTFGTLPLCAAHENIELRTDTGVLHGSLQVPPDRSPVPVVLLLSGSGPTDRDGNSPLLAGHNDSLRMLAEQLAAHGIASLRYDKRGIAASAAAGPKEANLRFETFVADAVAWGVLLRRDPRFGPLVVAGHSEGSLIGMLDAAQLPATAFISLSGPGRAAGAVILEQLRSHSAPAALAQQALTIVASLEAGRRVEGISRELAALFRPSVQPYLISWFRYDPSHEIAKLRMPVLILQGSTDIQVTVHDAQLLKDANPRSKLVVIEGMNHVLKMVPSGSEKQIASYGDPTLPLAPQVIGEATALVTALVRTAQH